MEEYRQSPEPVKEPDGESYPIEPRYHPLHRIPRLIYDFLASARLAMFLLVAILLCSLAAGTFLRGQRAWEYIFSTLWFNGLLVLLIINVACCFFGRIWGRRITLISFGMILFHLSFVALFAGVVYNSLFYFRGTIRLTEGETLPSWSPDSYDAVDKGRYFNWKLLKGNTSLLKMQYGFKVGGQERRAAYEIEVGEGVTAKRGLLYMLEPLNYRGFKYFRDKEGYTLLTILHDRSGQELYGAFIPLQSHRQPETKSYRYTTGTKDEAGFLQFPQPPVQPSMNLNVTFEPDFTKKKPDTAHFEVRELTDGPAATARTIAKGSVPVGTRFPFGDRALSVKEVRYWAAMAVRYEPGQPIILTSLWVGLFGMALTTIARVLRKRR